MFGKMRNIKRGYQMYFVDSYIKPDCLSKGDQAINPKTGKFEPTEGFFDSVQNAYVLKFSDHQMTLKTTTVCVRREYK